MKIAQLQSLRPIPLVKVHQHRLFQLRLSVVDGYRIVMPVKTMDERLYGWFVDLANVGRGLSCLASSNDGVGVDQSKGINDDLALHALDGVDHNSHRSGVERFERLQRLRFRILPRNGDTEIHTCCVLMSTLESQQPKPGCEWYQPTTISGLPKRSATVRAFR